MTNLTELHHPTLKLRASTDDFQEVIFVHIAVATEDQTLYLVDDMELIPLAEGARVISPSIMPLEKGAAMRLMDDLWSLGIRPSATVRNDGEIQALRSEVLHLRSLVDQTIPVLIRGTQTGIKMADVFREIEDAAQT